MSPPTKRVSQKATPAASRLRAIGDSDDESSSDRYTPTQRDVLTGRALSKIKSFRSRRCSNTYFCIIRVYRSYPGNAFVRRYVRSLNMCGDFTPDLCSTTKTSTIALRNWCPWGVNTLRHRFAHPYSSPCLSCTCSSCVCVVFFLFLSRPMCACVIFFLSCDSQRCGGGVEDPEARPPRWASGTEGERYTVFFVH